MFQHDQYPTEELKTTAIRKDERWSRNYNSDMHIAVDLMTGFIEELKVFHPLVYKHVKMLLTDGSYL